MHPFCFQTAQTVKKTDVYQALTVIQFSLRKVSYVSPEFGVLDVYIVELTGIRGNNLKGAPNFETAIGMLLEWIPEDATVVTWSNNDEIQIRKEAKKKGVYTPAVRALFKGAIDCQAVFCKKINVTQAVSLSTALLATSVKYDEHIHDAQADAYNTALIFIKIKKEPSLILNSYYSEQLHKVSHYNPFVEILSEFSCAV